MATKPLVSRGSPQKGDKIKSGFITGHLVKPSMHVAKPSKM